MIVSTHVRMEEESLRQAKVLAAKLGLSYSEFAAQAIASECIERDLGEAELNAEQTRQRKQARKGKS
jgi:hypothetical protein